MRIAPQMARRLVQTNFPVCHSDPEFEYWLMRFEIGIVRPRFYWGHPEAWQPKSPLQLKLEDEKRNAPKIRHIGRQHKPKQRVIVTKSDGTTMEIFL